MYRDQINNLDYPPELIRLYLCEGDSDDDTLVQLQTWGLEDERIRIIKHDTGIPYYTRSPRPERMQALSETGNVGWAAIAEEAWGNFALMLESDLLYKPDLLRRLIERRPDEADIFAPMIWVQVGREIQFYDIWAFRIYDKMFQPCGPAYYEVRYSEPFELDSVGSVVLIRMPLIASAGLRLGEADCIVGLCNDAREKGYRVFCDPKTDVLHPTVEGVS